MYEIRPYKSKRHATHNIILMHSVNLIRSDIFINDIVRRGTFKYTYDIWRNYWFLYQKKRMSPCHFFVELLDKDYVCMLSNAMQKQSYFLNELITNQIIDPKYKDSMLIVISENFHYDKPEVRLFEHIANDILSPYCYQFHLDFVENVLPFDDILLPDWKEKLEISDLKYEFQPMTYWDQNLFELYAKRYKWQIQNDGTPPIIRK